MLKLVLKSVNVDLGWGKEQCYTKIKGIALTDLLEQNMLSTSTEFDSMLEYSVFDVHYCTDDIPMLDAMLSELKSTLDDGSLMLFDSYKNYTDSKESGSGVFELVVSDLSDYDRVSSVFIKSVSNISIIDDVMLNIVAFDYVNRELKTLPLCSLLNNVCYDHLVVSDGTPMLLNCLSKDKYNVDAYCTLSAYRSLFNSAIDNGDIVVA